jgi:predicted phosphoribosyltransferase
MVKTLTIAALVALAACTTTPRGSFCSVSEPIRLRAEIVDQLSDEEVKEVLRHNAKGERLCRWKP